MKHLGTIFGIAGLALAVVLFARQDGRLILHLLLSAGLGLIAAALFHAVPMLLNARAWQVILPRGTRPRIGAMALAIWVRESVNGLLPVGRIGGEVVSYRLLRAWGVRRAPAAASLLVDMALALLSQLAFALIGLGLLVAASGAGGLARQLALGLVLMVPLGIAFILVQRAGIFETVSRILNKLAAGRLDGAIRHSLRIDRAVRTMYQRRSAVVACFLWQLIAWIAGAGEMWLAMYFLGHSLSVLQAIALEALIQAVSSAAFVVPAAIGVQEGGFLLVGAALGIDAPTALALAAARRLRDALIFFPGLLAWQWGERRIRLAAERTEQRRQEYERSNQRTQQGQSEQLAHTGGAGMTGKP
jgi:glycosyltransferase 2 family protein